MSIRIENPASPDLLPSTLKPAIEQISGYYKDVFSERLQSVYILGSAPRGEYRSGISDFDMRAIVRNMNSGEKEKVDFLSEPLREKYNIAKLELDVYTNELLDRNDWLQFYLLIDGLCIVGKPYTPPVPLPSTKEGVAEMLANHLLIQYERLPVAMEKLATGIIPEPRKGRSFAKRAIRLANTISILRTGSYTQNMDRIVQNVINFVPEVADAVRILNHYRITNPISLENFKELAQASDVVHKAVLQNGLGSNFLKKV